jgi:hypothetical protein
MAAQYWKAQTIDQLEQCFNFLRASFPKAGFRIEWKQWRDTRSLSQNAFQHVIYAEISAYLISRGRTDCNELWVKDMLKNQFLGWEEKEFVNIKTGEITVREVLRSTAGLDTGDAVHYTDQILAWAADIGCQIKIPTMCDYRHYKEVQAA